MNDVAVDGLYGVSFIPFFLCIHPDTSEVFMRKKTLFALVFSFMLLFTPSAYAYQLSSLDAIYFSSAMYGRKVCSVANVSKNNAEMCQYASYCRKQSLSCNEAQDDLFARYCNDGCCLIGSCNMAATDFCAAAKHTGSSCIVRRGF